MRSFIIPVILESYLDINIVQLFLQIQSYRIGGLNHSRLHPGVHQVRSYRTKECLPGLTYRARLSSKP
jgi:hypothetical protein